MAKRRITSTQRNSKDDTLIDIVDVKDQATDFFERHQKPIVYGFSAILLLIGGWLGYQNFIVQPKEDEAMKNMVKAVNLFERDSFRLALNNPGGGAAGFKDIVKKYSGTTTGNTAKLFGGLCLIQEGKYDEAITMLESYSPKDDITPTLKYSLLGDAHSEKNNFDKAYEFYKKSTETGNNEVIAPFNLWKFGMLCEKLKKYDEALNAYQTIQLKYSNSPQGTEIEKYLERVKMITGKTS